MKGPVRLQVDSRADALASARFLLGRFGDVKVRRGRFRVGVYLKPCIFTQAGEGKSWAAALNQAQQWAIRYFEGHAQRELEKDEAPPPGE